ncbi:hypothetical protein [Asanoa siamensis]|nr:hypothetical protein [Asanoa siamensis]
MTSRPGTGRFHPTRRVDCVVDVANITTMSKAAAPSRSYPR